MKESLAQLQGFKANGVNAYDPAFDAWKKRTHRTIHELFGTSQLLLGFSRLHFCEPRVQMYTGRHRKPEPEWLDMDQARFDRDTATAEQLLLDAIEDASGEAEASPAKVEQDSLTGLLPRSALDHALATQIDQTSDPLGTAMLDVDKFKAVNDTHGHPKGDAVLKAVAGAVHGVVAGKGSVYRYGGEEFLILLPNHEIEEATAVAERIRRAIEANEMAGLRITVSIGVASYPAHADSAGALIESADKALYDAKNRGRNLVRVFGEVEAPVPARVPAKKSPTPGQLTDEDALSIRAQYFRTGMARCPKDDAILEVSKTNVVGTELRPV